MGKKFFGESYLSVVCVCTGYPLSVSAQTTMYYAVCAYTNSGDNAANCFI